jgi:hypothetical protein
MVIFPTYSPPEHTIRIPINLANIMPTKSAEDIKGYNVHVAMNGVKVTQVSVWNGTVNSIEVHWHHLSDEERESMKVKYTFIWQPPNSRVAEEYPCIVDFSSYIGRV